MGKRRVSVGIIGWGTVGSGVVRILLNQRDFIMKPDELSIDLRKIADLVVRLSEAHLMQRRRL